MKTTTTTDKIQIGESTTGTSTSTTYTWHCPSGPSRAEQGWECPRCGRINAPWKSQCNCLGGNQYPTWCPWDYKEPWQTQVTCNGKPIMNSDTFKVHPESTTWEAPSSMCGSDSTTCKVDGTTTAWNANTAITTGGSDYWNSATKNWENVPHTLTNMQKELDEIKSTFNNTLKRK